MKGISVLIEPLARGGHLAVRLVNGVPDDLLIDPPAAHPTPRPGAVYLGVPERPLKGLGGLFVDLGGGQRGFLRAVKGIAPGRPIPVQVAGHAEGAKAVPLTTRIALRGVWSVLTPGAPGVNVSRRIGDPMLRAHLAALAQAAMAGAPADCGLILRSAAEQAEADAIRAEIAAHLADWDRIAAASGAARCLLPAPGAQDLARQTWSDPFPDEVAAGPGLLAARGIWDQLEQALAPRVALGPEAFMIIEPTAALVAVDVNTGGDGSPAAGLKANLAAMRALPRALRLRGLGGQIVVDCAPMTRKDRAQIEGQLRAALRDDPVETTAVGWTPLGHLEITRKRARLPTRGLMPREAG